MYAIIEDGGRQFKVSEGDVIEVDLRDAKSGDAIEFGKVLLCSDGESCKIGAPYIEAAAVAGEIQEEFKARKVVSYKYTRREPYHRKVGHRQRYLRVKITGIRVP